MPEGCTTMATEARVGGRERSMTAAHNRRGRVGPTGSTPNRTRSPTARQPSPALGRPEGYWWCRRTEARDLVPPTGDCQRERLRHPMSQSLLLNAETADIRPAVRWCRRGDTHPKYMEPLDRPIPRSLTQTPWSQAHDRVSGPHTPGSTRGHGYRGSETVAAGCPGSFSWDLLSAPGPRSEANSCRRAVTPGGCTS